MKKTKKIISVLLCAVLLSAFMLPSFANELDYAITNPYADVASLLGDDDNHYKTNLHTHSTISDANEDYDKMIKGYYDRDFDILGFADHGVIGKNWNEKPTQLPLYLYQYIIGNKVTKLTDEEFYGILDGSYASDMRTKERGMQCVPTGIELNMLTLTKSHVNGYFCGFGEGDIGFENGFEYAVKGVDKAGGISVINHPGDWLESAKDFSVATKPENVRLFGDIFNKYESCVGMEILNENDSPTKADRVLWDALLQYVIPHGERNIWGFSNSDAHDINHIDTSFMDFIMPEYSIDNVKDCMETGKFFAIGRRAYLELGDGYVGTGAYPTVTSIDVDEENDVITVTGKNADKIEWIANGNIIAETTVLNADGTITSTLRLREHSDEITCYVRFQLTGEGGVCFAQPFVVDDGNMASYIIEDTRTDMQKAFDKFIYILKSLRIYVIFQEIIRAIKK